jgi:hypothetical protein
MRRGGLLLLMAWASVPCVQAQWIGSSTTDPTYHVGNVGIGASPTEKLSVFLDVPVTSYIYAQFAIHGATQPTKVLAIGYDTTNNNGFIQAAEQGVAYRNLLLQKEGGSVGIGGQPASPEILTIFGEANATPPVSYLAAQVAIHGLASQNHSNMRLAIGYDTVNNRGFVQAAEQSVALRDLALQPDGAEVVIGPSGATAGEHLRVNGDVLVSGNIGAKYQDVAEWVETSEADLVSGMVVTIYPASRNRVIASATEYDTAVAGVVSERPGIILGSPSPSNVMVATAGRVRVRADASGGRSTLAIC